MFKSFWLLFFAFFMGWAATIAAAQDSIHIFESRSVQVDSILKQSAKKNTTTIPESAIPAPCQGQCSPSVLGVMTGCTTDAGCACDMNNDKYIADCTSCLVDNNAITKPLAQALVEDYEHICASMNMNVVTGTNGVPHSFGFSIKMLGSVMAATLVGMLL